MQRGEPRGDQFSLILPIAADGEVDERGEGASEQLSYDEEDVSKASASVDIVKDVMKRLLKVRQQIKGLLTKLENTRNTSSLENPSYISVSGSESIEAQLHRLDDVELFLWGRMSRLLHEEHQRCADVYATTLDMHDRMPFESLTHTVHHNSTFCEYMGDVVEKNLAYARRHNEDRNIFETEHWRTFEKTQVLATYCALMVVEGSRESFLDPMSMDDLCKKVIEEKNRRKRLVSLSLMFSMLDQDDQALGEALNQQLPHILMQRMRHLVHRIFGHPDRNDREALRDNGGSPCGYNSAVIRSDPNSPLSSRKASPELFEEVSNRKRNSLSPSSGAFRANDMLHLTPSSQNNAKQGLVEPQEFTDAEEDMIIGVKRNSLTNFTKKDDSMESSKKKLRTEEDLHSKVLFNNEWKPQKGERVGRGPDWCFKNQGGGCDFGEIVEITTTQEVLVQWINDIDIDADIKTHIYRYKFCKPYEHIVPWRYFLDVKSMSCENINFKLQEFLLVCAVVGVFCHQREGVLPALQFQAIESMIHVLDSVDFDSAATIMEKTEKEVISTEKHFLGFEEEDGAIDENTLESHLLWNLDLRREKERYREAREVVARVGWVLNSLLSHKKLALIFLQLDGLRRVMKLLSGYQEVATTYGCCIMLSQLSKSAVFESLLRNHNEYFDPIMRFIMDQWKNAESHDVQGSAGGFLFQALSFPCVVSFFDLHQGPQTTMEIIERLLKNSEERFDVVYPGLTMAGLKCMYVYLLSHLMLSTRVVFRRHRLLSGRVTNCSPYISLPRDTTTIESILGILSASSALLPDVSIETVQSLLTRERLVSFRFLADNNFHQLLLRCVQFYFSQSRWDLLAASLNVLFVLAVVPFFRTLIADARYPDSVIVHLIMIVNDLAGSVRNGNTTREMHLIPCVVTALQILLYLIAPPTDKNDEAAVASFNQVCGVVRASDGVRTLLEILRIRKDAVMSSKLHFFPVVARALELMVILRRYADTRLLFDALGVNAVARELLVHYEDVQKEYISMMGDQYVAGDTKATGRFMENVKCFLFDEANKTAPTISVDPVELEVRQAIIARSNIDYSRESLLELICRHLDSEGLRSSALNLRSEARLLPDSFSSHQFNNAPLDGTSSSTMGSALTLDGIVRSYLRQQHENCTNPIATLPQFDLRKNHVYHPQTAPVDYMRNYFNRRLAQKMGIDFPLRMQLNENHLTYRCPGHLFDITGGGDGIQGDSIAFCDNGDTLIVGTSEGAVALFDTFPDDTSADKLIDQHVVFDNEGVVNISVSHDGSLISVVGGDHTVGVMRRSELPAFKYRVEGSRAARFSNDNVYLLTTCDEEHTCRLHDLMAQREVFQFSDPSWVGENMDNVATFDAFSQLILSDAILWDIRCCDKPIYRFDRFTESFCNVFHPSSPLVLIDEKVWDMRTRAIVRTVPSFRQTSSFHFSNIGQVIYSFREASTLTNNTNAVLSVVDSFSFDNVFSTELRPPFRTFAVDPSDRYCAAVCEHEVEAVVRVFSTSSGPLPGQKSFPFTQDDCGIVNDEEIADDDDEDDAVDHDSFWSYDSEEYETDEESDDDDDDDGDDESDVGYQGTLSETGTEAETDDGEAEEASSREGGGETISEDTDKDSGEARSICTSLSST